MRGLCWLWAVVLAIATPAHAVVLGSNGTLALQISQLQSLVVAGSTNVVINGSGPAGHLTGLQVPAGVFAMSGAVLPVTDPYVSPPFGGIQLNGANGIGSFGGSGDAGFGGSMPILGAAKLCMFGPCSAALVNLSVPLSVVGQGGAAFLSGLLDLTLIGAPWTTGTAAVGTLTAMGGVSPISDTGAGDGVVQLVTPIFISENSGDVPVLRGFGFLTLHFVPEPGTILLVGSGLAFLLARARSRMRR